MTRVLIVEDHRDIAELLRYNLETDSLDVTVACDGGPALAELRANAFDLLVLDLMLPEMSGLEVCKAVRCDPLLRDLPILILTARGEESICNLAFSLGANDYLLKPFHPSELRLRVRNLLCRQEIPQPAEVAEWPGAR